MQNFARLEKLYMKKNYIRHSVLFLVYVYFTVYMQISKYIIQSSMMSVRQDLGNH